ncbi:BgTH12-06266 [Blumeria graminis f. sp. triticale]|uniref:Bgt-1860 n=3 Tax=Blumeria graminis TaxID=34373 RepID=A0A061HPM5_BLUGR|nr:hypothetical protein BGT96224_1860 [Blumeria graminis f. sp. tritici 96224]CAD6500556.1 BgTH12-06266 [Blumeria graminis f. sp. triticale]VCU40822.1 Bgt-1860 [Blumeria graminis f. sp. tritici]
MDPDTFKQTIPAMITTTLPIHPKIPTSSHLLKLPSELIEEILLYLDPFDLTSIITTCSYLASLARSDALWHFHVQQNVPGIKLISPFPCLSYRQLYAAHFPHWFIPRNKVWFGSQDMVGKLIITRYNPVLGQIEGYQLVAERLPTTSRFWDDDGEVLIEDFNPNCRLNLEQPIISLDTLEIKKSGKRFSEATTMKIDWPRQFLPRTSDPSRHLTPYYLSLAKENATGNEENHDVQLWPPKLIPARNRFQIGGPHCNEERPQRYSELSEQCFSIQHKINPRIMDNPSMHLCSLTYATLDPQLYTPTREKPYRGIWVGDYSGHGCEFLLLHQPDNPDPFDESAVIREIDETLEDFELRKEEERIYRGSIEAIKLTGDPNVPRGEHSFIAADISNKGLIYIAKDKAFKGARVVRSAGHIAADMFQNDHFIECQLILGSYNRLAQHWIGFGQVSFLERVNIDDFLSPSS